MNYEMSFEGMVERQYVHAGMRGNQNIAFLSFTNGEKWRIDVDDWSISSFGYLENVVHKWAIVTKSANSDTIQVKNEKDSYLFILK